MTSLDSTETLGVPASSRPLSSLKLKTVLALGTCVTLIAASLAWLFWLENTPVPSPAIAQAAQEQCAELQVDLASVENTVQSLSRHIETSRGLEMETRDLMGIGQREPLLASYNLAHAFPVEGPSQTVDLAPSLYKATAEAKEAKESYRQILATMAQSADVWHGIPSLCPIDGGRFSSRYGTRNDPFTGRIKYHHGLDISAPWGTPIRSSATGVVKRARWVSGYGLLVELDHGNGISTRYAHVSSMDVSEGDRVERGEVVAYVGATGRATSPHLHYEVRVHGLPVNPKQHIFASGLLAD
ncbi:MAG: M23 family metallopeptidase [Candidatus Eisenbacteria bacterium]|uniref:M23 family metallopeptidase n=1 Tax=Eiseniibacteriota bacterium TaxID=2212470 RepID=A0A7Y2H3F5_UNCEI|nr:M23 family metallopeptidase [Candidatus Eisenbacteria bacterium]